MRRVALCALLLAASSAAAEVRDWDFRVFLDDREIGRHRFELRSDAGGRSLTSEARFEVRVLGIPAYRYEHAASERWRGDCLESLRARTNDNGSRSEVDWREREGGCTLSFAYWNTRILDARRLLNAQTGVVEPVSFTARGEETIQVRGLPVLAQRHRLNGAKLAIDLWYAGGEWVALESATAGGRLLRYRLF